MQMRPNKLAEIAAAQNKTVHELIRDAVQAEGSVNAAARALGVSRTAISYHLGQMGLRIVTEITTRLVKADA